MFGPSHTHVWSALSDCYIFIFYFSGFEDEKLSLLTIENGIHVLFFIFLVLWWDFFEILKY